MTVDGDALALSVLRGHLRDRVTVVRWRSSDFLTRMPLVEVHVIPGGDPGRAPGQTSVVDLAIEAWAAEPDEASDLADACIAALLAARRAQRVHAGGSLVRVTVTAAPGEVREADQPGGVAHWTTQLELRLRPARA